MQRTDVYPREPLELIRSTIKDAVRNNATDIHWEPLFENNDILLALRFRIDGVLKNIAKLDKKQVNFEAVINALKIMAGMDTTKKRKEQDGRAKFDADGVTLDLRFSSMPLVLGGESSNPPYK